MKTARLLSPRLQVWLVVAGIGLVGGAVLRRVDLVVLAAPFVLVPVAGLARSRPPDLVAETAPDRTRIVEGDDVTLTIRLSSALGAGRVELGAILPRHFTAVGPRRRAVMLPPGAEREVDLTVRPDRWGTYDFGGVVVRVRDPAGLVTWLVEVDPHEVLRVHPAPETVRTLARPHDTQLATGTQVARHKGPGMEPAGLRPFVAGDRSRDVNWRATARRGEMWVNERHPEHTTDVVVFLDAFAEVDVIRGVRAAVSVAGAFLADRDQVGLVTLGGTLTWVRPGWGRRQEARMIDHLLSTIVRDFAVHTDLAVLAPGVLPPRSLVVAVSPLEDDRAVAVLADLRDRSIDLAVIEVVTSEPGEAGVGTDRDLERRLWILHREMVRSQLRHSGVPVAPWPEGRPIEAVLAELREVRRRGRLVRR